MSAGSDAAAVHVAVAVILDTDGRVLLTRRADDAHQGGLWEFPGGKLEAGESLAEGLGRELREELGIQPTRTSALLEVRHDYGDKQVLLDVHVVWEFAGEPRALEGQPMRWVDVGQLREHAFPAANQPIVAAVELLSLPAASTGGDAGQ
ncbi:8-oxo-dGTP diphosphatase MutT [Mangrovimicrobium sediminis]|uniref:8-oxo-dGTP diphosphatase n=1 Tax=Mangrovimicrobium sediminis TaxID=2562682 RepID=A0A4Z0M3N0_9GAMM|nr:8-oxo-dGTP diphosphatase MutT [Haliea sp. SAOS-164]TGD74056.1 8-oxo-dGTP diphosphatase MutT [Haliea sp. SAOS-164]